MGRGDYRKWTACAFLMVFALSILCPIELKASNECRTSIKVLKSKPKTFVRLLAKATSLGAIGLAVFIGAPAIQHELIAHEAGMKHLGAGIFLDFENVLATVHPHYRPTISQLLVKSKTQALNREEALFVANIFSDLLYGDYDQSARWPEVFPSPRAASDYLESCNVSSRGRGVCRHKSIILTGILNEFGVRAEIELNVGLHDRAHVWVRLSDWNLVLDPTNMARSHLSFGDFYLPNYSKDRSEFLNEMEADLEINGFNPELQIVTTSIGRIHSYIGGAVR